MTFGVGSTLFDDRYGLAGKLPRSAHPDAAVPQRRPGPAQTGGDLILQLSAGNADTVLHALRDIARHTRGGMQINWRMDGFTSPARPAGHGAAQPDGVHGRHREPGHRCPRQMDTGLGPAGHRGRARLDRRRQLLRGPADPDVRRVLGPGGRLRAGADDRAPTAPPASRSTRAACSRRPTSRPTRPATVIPLNAHIRLANPRTPQTADSRILRRAYNYDRGIDQVGDLDQGLIFTCFQQDIKRQFEAVADAADRRAAGRLHQPVRRRLLPGAARCARHGATSSAARC